MVTLFCLRIRQVSRIFNMVQLHIHLVQLQLWQLWHFTHCGRRKRRGCRTHRVAPCLKLALRGHYWQLPISDWYYHTIYQTLDVQNCSGNKVMKLVPLPLPLWSFSVRTLNFSFPKKYFNRKSGTYFLHWGRLPSSLSAFQSSFLAATWHIESITCTCPKREKMKRTTSACGIYIGWFRMLCQRIILDVSPPGPTNSYTTSLSLSRHLNSTFLSYFRTSERVRHIGIAFLCQNRSYTGSEQFALLRPRAKSFL